MSLMEDYWIEKYCGRIHLFQNGESRFNEKFDFVYSHFSPWNSFLIICFTVLAKLLYALLRLQTTVFLHSSCVSSTQVSYMGEWITIRKHFSWNSLSSIAPCSHTNSNLVEMLEIFKHFQARRNEKKRKHHIMIALIVVTIGWVSANRNKT